MIVAGVFLLCGPVAAGLAATPPVHARTAVVGGASGHKPLQVLSKPAPLVPFGGTRTSGEGNWQPAGRRVDGRPAVYETSLAPPGGGSPAGISWMDTRLLAARLYSGSESPGGGPYRFTAPIEPPQARTLVAAFNGGFKMPAAAGGYYTQGHTIVPLRAGAASLVIDHNGDVALGAWGRDVHMTRAVASVRQNLTLLVDGGRPTPQVAHASWLYWGATCGATSCNGPGIENQWRSGVGITANGALVYVTGPSLAPAQLADLLVRARAVRAMELDINPDWTVFVAYDPQGPNGLATPANGAKLLATTVQGPWTFFAAWWARDFVTMSAR